MRLVFVRHGETVWSGQLKIQGKSDVALAPAGERQAKLLAENFAGKPDYLFVSPLKRAYDFALPLARRFRLQPEIDVKLREIDFGAWEGRSFAEMPPEMQVQYAAWCEDPFRITPPGGEAFSQLTERVRAFLAQTQKRLGEEECAVAVTHGGVIRTAVALAMQMPLRLAARLRIEAASTTILECYGGDWYLVKFNCAEYLRQSDGKGE